MSSRPDRQFSSVVFPEPDGPITATNSPSLTRQVEAVERGDFAGAGAVGLHDRLGAENRVHTVIVRRSAVGGKGPSAASARVAQPVSVCV